MFKTQNDFKYFFKRNKKLSESGSSGQLYRGQQTVATGSKGSGGVVYWRKQNVYEDS
jgi:hypothetical protein